MESRLRRWGLCLPILKVVACWTCGYPTGAITGCFATRKRWPSTISERTNGVSQANAQYVSWGTGIYDFDNDGLLDILIFHGGLIHLIPQEHTLFRGLGKRPF